MQSTKALNKLIKKRGITKDRAKQIKQERRTLKNRGNIHSSHLELAPLGFQFLNFRLKPFVDPKQARARAII